MSSEENNRDRPERDEKEPREPSARDAQGSEGKPENDARAEHEEAVEGEVVSESEAEPEDESEEVDPEEGEPEEPETVEADQVAELTAELEAARAERDEHLDSVKRLRAEFENTRKRAERERERIMQSASEKLVAELLPVLDNLDRALEAEGDIREGVRSTRDQLVSILSDEGLSPVASDGEHFDPNVHEAVMGQPSDEYEDGTVIQTFERGYVLNGKPIRPAKVVVARQG